MSSKISALGAATTPLDGDELLPIVQDGVTKQTTVDWIIEGVDACDHPSDPSAHHDPVSVGNSDTITMELSEQALAAHVRRKTGGYIAADSDGIYLETPLELEGGGTEADLSATGPGAVVQASGGAVFSIDTQLVLERGGTEANLGATGPGAVVQASGGAAFTVDTQLVLERGGTEADLSATGGAGYYLQQASAGAVVTVSTIAAAHLPTATDAVQGAVELATDAETQTGSATDRAVTPANLRADVPATPAASRGVRLDASGHLQMPAAGDIYLTNTAAIGVTASDERIEFYAAGYIGMMGAWVGIGQATPYSMLELEEVYTLTEAEVDAGAACLTLDPGYTGAYTVTRHSYIFMQDVSLADSAVVTDAVVVQFDAAAGTHKAVDSGSTKTTPGAVDAWLKFNLNGTLVYVPAYTSKTA